MEVNTVAIMLGSIAIIAVVILVFSAILMGQKHPELQSFIIKLLKAVKPSPRQVPFIHIGNYKEKE